MTSARRSVLVSGEVVAVVLLAGCGLGLSTADDPEPRPGELADAGGRPCPPEMPVGDDPAGHGFGASTPATGKPALLEPEQAWVCEYRPEEAGETSSGGTTFRWVRHGPPAPVSPAELSDLSAALDDLVPVDHGRACTSDLGSRWMVAYVRDGDLTGVVVDDYGCHDVRLSDDPYGTAPGADEQEGAVGGVLDGGRDILGAVGVGPSG